MPTLHNVTTETTLDKALDLMGAPIEEPTNYKSELTSAEKEAQWEANRKARKIKRYIKLHREIDRHFRGVESNSPFKDDAERAIMKIMESAPSGSGFDSGTKLIGLNLAKNNHPDWLRFETAFHHMNDMGMYDGWTEHTITVKPDLSFGFTLAISGRNRNDIKDYIHEMFESWLNEEVREFED